MKLKDTLRVVKVQCLGELKTRICQACGQKKPKQYITYDKYRVQQIVTKDGHYIEWLELYSSRLAARFAIDKYCNLIQEEN